MQLSITEKMSEPIFFCLIPYRPSTLWPHNGRGSADTLRGKPHPALPALPALLPLQGELLNEVLGRLFLCSYVVLVNKHL